MKTEQEAISIINKHIGLTGKMIASSKSDYYRKHPDNIIVFNANIFADGFMPNKLWWGDIDITNESMKLMWASKEIGATLYVLREMDGRFTNELNPDYKKVAIWNTNM